MDVFPVIFGLVFVAVIAMFFVTIGRSVSEWSRNNASPIMTTSAAVVAKRTQVGRTGTDHAHSYTNYYVTFELAGGERMEFRVKGEQYGIMVEGDSGTLSYQGSRFLAFERD